MPQVSRDLQRSLVKIANFQCTGAVRHRSAQPRAPVIPEAASVGGLVDIRPSLQCRLAKCRLHRAMSEFEGQSGKHLLALSSSQFDPQGMCLIGRLGCGAARISRRLRLERNIFQPE